MAAFLLHISVLPRSTRETRTPLQTRRHPLATAAPPERQTSPLVQAVVHRLRTELPTLFSPTSQKDYSLYAPTVTFEDPLNKFRGVSRLAANIAFLNASPVFTSASLTLYDIAVIGQARDIVRTRWALRMTANLPWRPVVAFTGQSDYVVDLASGKVVRHVDYWDSLADSAFFSLPAVADLLSQCKPGRVSPQDLGGFRLLRRTRGLEIRCFEREGHAGVVLKPGREGGGMREWAVVGDQREGVGCCVVGSVAVKALGAAPQSVEMLRVAERDVTEELSGATYAKAGERSFYVKAIVNDRPVHELWLELVSAHANVDV